MRCALRHRCRICLTPSLRARAPAIFTCIFSLICFPTAPLQADATPDATAPVAVTRWHYDSSNTGQNLSEHILNPANVNAKTFGKLFTQPIDGYAYASPLYVPCVKINAPGGTNNGPHNVLFVATEHDSVYAFDADNNTGKNTQPLWKVSFIDPTKNIGTIPFIDEGTEDLVPEIGITGTPVIDLNSGTIYLVSRTKELRGPPAAPVTHYLQLLHALDIATGAEKSGGPLVLGDTIVKQTPDTQVEICDSILQFPGTGCPRDTLIDGRVIFNAFSQNQRAGLILLNGLVYVAWGSHGDHPPAHGWIAAFDAKTLALQSEINLSPDGSLSTVWMSGATPAVDASGNLYAITGNGTFSANRGGRDYGDTVLKISPSPAGKNPWDRLTVTDYFTPFAFDMLSDRDLDLGSGGPLLLPPQPGPHPRELVAAGKEGTLYLIDTDRMGHVSHPGVGPDDCIQAIPADTLFAKAGGSPSIINSAAYWNGDLYYTGRERPLLQIPVKNGLLSTDPDHRGTTEFDYPYPTPQISADGARDGIAWIQDFGMPGILYAYDASDVSHELWDSEQSGIRDRYGGSVKFALPVVANGKVYVGGQSMMAAYGLLGSPSGAAVGTAVH
jgi:hypothetical protein